MKFTFSAFLMLFFISFSFAQTVNIIPIPVEVKLQQGTYSLPQEVSISVSDAGKLGFSADLLKNKISGAANYKAAVGNNTGATIKLDLLSTADASIGSEGYLLNVGSSGISIKANTPAGIYYGVQSLLQLLPAEIESKEAGSSSKNWSIPYVDIKDYPRMQWRGLMLDVSRHFFTVDEVKQYIDAMVRFKFNKLHWHLTDDEGWRIEIKSYPNLTKKGAWNVKKVGNFGTFSKPTPDEPRDYGGFYTQEQIKDIVQYAKERFVDVMPEIDVPGHSLATVASYPELSCTPGADKYQVRSGEQFMDWSKGPPPIAFLDNTLCPANEKVYTFLDKVFGEVATLFPFEYIHAGGDEAPFNFWEKSPQIKALMAKEKLKDMHAVQGYFTKRVEKIIQSKGKKMIGWNEILDGDINTSTAIMSWTGEKAGIEASQKGHNVVMTPTTFAYLDYMQADVATEPRVYASLRMKKSYEFDPVPKGANSKFILGGQGNLWTEQIYNIRQAEYMTWPRGLAIAESLWSPQQNKNWSNFISRVENQFERWNNSETKYSPAIYDPSIEVQKTNNKFFVKLTPEIDSLDLYYSFDNSMPDRWYPKYNNQPVEIPKDAALFKVISYKGKNEIGRMVTIPVADLKKRVK